MRLRFPLCSAVLALLAHAAHAQQPTLPGAPQPVPPATSPPAPAVRTAALPQTEVVGHPGEVVGQTYSVETKGGTQFNGTLREATDTALTFETKELGIVTVQRSSLRQLTSQTPEQARRGFDYVGNGTRMFFAPTARNLHQGEGNVDVIDIFLLGIDYGLTDNLSVGALVPVVPGLGVPAIAVTPKVSVPVGDKFRVGAGLLYGFATGLYGTSGSAGVGYGMATYGTADNNISFGLGYGFVGGDGVGSTPVGVLGANVRVSRLLSLVNETYLADFGSSGSFGGLAGLRLAFPRLSGNLGFLYYNGRYDSGFYPAYLSVSYRFGKVRLK